jgi:carboxyl-terminal processing protease
MLTRWMRGLVVGLAVLLVPAVSHAAADDQPGTPYVILVGIDKTGDPQILKRDHAESDAKRLYDLFVNKDNLGAPEKNIKLLLGSADAKRPHQIATKENILDAFRWLAKTAGKDDLVIVAYLGEGAALGERSCYFSTDSTFKDRAKNAVASGDIQNSLDKLVSQKFVAFIDVNFMGYKVEGTEKPVEPNLTNLYREYLGDEEAKANLPSRAVFMPNIGLKPSIETDKGGLFTQVLVDGLEGKADSDGYEPDGNITIDELVKYFRKEMVSRERELKKLTDERGQSPVVFDFHMTDFIIDHNPAAYPKAKERLDKLATVDLPKEQMEEGLHLLSRMPKLESQQDLRKAYQKLADGTIDVAAFTKDRDAVLASTRLPAADAESFAKYVMSAARMVKTGYVKDVGQPTMIESAIKGMYKHLNEKMPSALSDKLADIKNLREADLFKLLVEARTQLGKREDLAKGKDVTAALNSLLEKLDRHTGYIDPETVRSFTTSNEGKFSGIGVQIRKNNIRDQLQVVTPIYGSPAYKAKIYADDIITNIVREVDGEGKPLEKPDVIPTKGMTTEQAVEKILGKPGTKVKIVVEREGEKVPLEFNLIRGTVEVESVLGHKRNADDSWNYVIDPENKICYVRLTQFSGNTAHDLEKLMKTLNKQGIKGFVLDLRFNPGGLLDAAVRISDLFIDDGMIVTIRPRNGPETSYVGKSDGSYTTFPMVCLVNGGSASASEIVSACLQDHGRAIVVGTRSYGKGSVQTIHPFDTGGRLKLTTATFWRPSNKNLNKASTSGKDEDEWGVTPNAGYTVKISPKELGDLQDFERESEIIHRPGYVPPPDSKIDFQDRQLEAALKYLREQIKSPTKVTMSQSK